MDCAQQNLDFGPSILRKAWKPWQLKKMLHELERKHMLLMMELQTEREKNANQLQRQCRPEQV